MNGHRKEILKSQDEEVTDAITKLQLNGVNCIFFTKKELKQLNQQQSNRDNKMRKTKDDQPNLNDLLDYADIKSINTSSLTIQLNNHNCLGSPQVNRKLGRRKGKRKQVPNRRKRRNGNAEYVDDLTTAVGQPAKSGIANDDHIHHDYFTNGFTTPPPRLSPQCSDFPAGRITVSPFSSVHDQAHVQPPILELAEVFDEAVVETVENLVDSVVRLNEEQLSNIYVGRNVEVVIQSVSVSPTKYNDAHCLQGQETTAKKRLPRTEHSLNDTLPFPGEHDATLSHAPNGSFYSLVTNNVRQNLENYLDGKMDLPISKKLKGDKAKRKKRYQNGYLLHHGDNYPDDPELSYKLNLATQILMKLNRKRYSKPKSDKRKSMLAYLGLVSKRPVRTGKFFKSEDLKTKPEVTEEKSVFNGEWTRLNKYVCGICAHVETDFWDMVTHKGEEHSGAVVTHVELPVSQEVPKTLIREVSQTRTGKPEAEQIPACTKCSVKFCTIPELHRHIFECSGNTAWLQDQVVVKKGGKCRRRKRQGLKRRLSNNTPKKTGCVTATTTACTVTGNKPETPSKRKPAGGPRTNASTFKCKFCVRHFKTEGWLKNHQATHTLLVSIPLSKLPKQSPANALSLPEQVAQQKKTRASTNWSHRRFTRAMVAA